MPRREDLKSILLIGSGPIVIGQACEFDYSGTQACRALRREGYRVILVNSNPATIMTDPEFSDATYVEPLVPEVVEKILERERPDALLPTVGGQTGINLTLALDERGTSSPAARTVSRKRSRSSARQIASGSAPISSTRCLPSVPSSDSCRARSSAVPPPSVGSSASGFSRSITLVTEPGVSGSM